MKRADMTQFRGFKKAGRNNEKAAIDLLDGVIGANPKTIRQIAVEVDRDYESIRCAIAKLRKMTPSPIRIAGWHKGEKGLCPAAMYLWQQGEDVARPKPTSSAEKCRRYRETEHGKKVGKEATKRWMQTPAADEYKRRRYQTVKAARERKRNAYAATVLDHWLPLHNAGSNGPSA